MKSVAGRIQVSEALKFPMDSYKHVFDYINYMQYIT
jgi:hypothetical protein